MITLEEIRIAEATFIDDVKTYFALCRRLQRMKSLRIQLVKEIHWQVSSRTDDNEIDLGVGNPVLCLKDKTKLELKPKTKHPRELEKWLRKSNDTKA